MTTEQTKQDLQAKARAKLAASGISAPTARQQTSDAATIASGIRLTNILLAVMLLLQSLTIAFVGYQYASFRSRMATFSTEMSTQADQLSQEAERLKQKLRDR